jgi:hypothetical protein
MFMTLCAPKILLLLEFLHGRKIVSALPTLEVKHFVPKISVWLLQLFMEVMNLFSVISFFFNVPSSLISIPLHLMTGLLALAFGSDQNIMERDWVTWTRRLVLARRTATVSELRLTDILSNAKMIIGVTGTTSSRTSNLLAPSLLTFNHLFVQCSIIVCGVATRALTVENLPAWGT